MDAARWERIEALFQEALRLPHAERGAFLLQACTEDPSQIGEVQSLLEGDVRGLDLLDRDLAEVAGEVLDMPVPIARHLGPYRLVRLLGEGGMGVVFLAERDDLGGRAAIKVLRDASLSPARRERFAAEQRTLAQLGHPSIAQLHDAATLADGTPYFVMEYVEGVPLTEYCRTHPCSLPERLRLFRTLCEAVQFAHRHAIVHRDVKPSNVLVTHDGAVKLLDFGIAKHLENLDTPADQTRTALRLMTPAYAAPEQIRGHPVGTYTDVYALGVVLYELLTGRHPFDLSQCTPGQAEAVILDQEPEKPSARVRRAAGAEIRGLGLAGLSRSAWADLDVLCQTAMHKDPQRRYRTVEALVRDLDHYLKGEPLEARPDSVRYRLGKYLWRNRRAVSVAATVGTLLVGLVGFYTVRLAQARDSALAEAMRTQRIQTFMLDLFEGGDEAAGPADTLRVLTLLEGGVREAASLETEPAVQAELFHTLGGLYQKRGDFERADSLLRGALMQRRALFGSDHPQVASSLVALGLLRGAKAEAEEAERLIRDGLAMSRRHLPSDHPGVLQALSALGTVLQQRGAYPEAIAVLEDAVQLQSRRAARSRELTLTLSELANTHFYAGNYEIADSLNRRLLSLNRELYGERHPHVADDLINLGAIQFQRGLYPEAERYYRQGHEIILSFYGPRHYRTAAALTMLARSQVSQQRPEEAEGLLQHALEIQIGVYGPEHPRVASIFNELGRIALGQNDLAAAEARFGRMASIYSAAYGPEHYNVGTALSNLSTVYRRGEQYARAELVMRRAVGIFAGALSEDHLDTGIARIKLGGILVQLHRYAEAEEQLLAGYEIVTRKAEPSVSWLQTAREDLVTVYTVLGQSEKAARFRTELERTPATQPGK